MTITDLMVDDRIHRPAFGRRAGRVPTILATWIAAWMLGAAHGQAQGLRVGRYCDGDACVGEAVGCDLTVMHADDFGNAIELLDAWTIIDPEGRAVRVPSEGSLIIAHVDGNTTCATGGVLPCLVCAGGVACGGAIPISLEPGAVIFVQDQYLATDDDSPAVDDQAQLRFRSTCDQSPQGCSILPVIHQASSSTRVVVCDTRECNWNGQCERGEDCAICPEDCPSYTSGCGNGVCEPTIGEDCGTCRADCNGQRSDKPGMGFCCGSGDVGCEDPRCSTRGFACTCEPVQFCCGDLICGGAETACDCPLDCGAPPTTEDPDLMCLDGLDNDCDGRTDGDDPDCPCLPKSASCASNSDCCSQACTRRGTCR